MALGDIKFIIEALRSGAQPMAKPGRRVRGSLNDSTTGEAQRRAQYNRYLKISEGTGDSPLSYEEWIQQ